MTDESKSGPPACEFNTANLTFTIEELISNGIGAISPAVEQLVRLIAEHSCAPGNEYAVELSLQEALANAILHGNHQDPSKKIRICCACEADGKIIIVVKDEGKGFDPRRVPSPLVGENIYSAHGRGIYLINMLMDEVHFERGGREIHMRKG